MNNQTKIQKSDDETLKAGCAIVNDQGEVLLVSLSNKDEWSFPKGHQEVGETLEQTALREVMEETGFSVVLGERLSDLTYTSAESGEHIRVAMFRAKPLGQTGQPEPQTKMKWFSISEAKNVMRKNVAFLLDELVK